MSIRWKRIYYHKKEAICFAMDNLKPYAILLKAVKIDEKNFGELLVIRLIRRSFLPPTFFTIRYFFLLRKKRKHKVPLIYDQYLVCKLSMCLTK